MIKNTLPNELGNPQSLKKQLQQSKSFPPNVPTVGKDLLWGFYRLFYFRPLLNPVMSECPENDQTPLKNFATFKVKFLTDV